MQLNTTRKRFEWLDVVGRNGRSGLRSYAALIFGQSAATGILVLGASCFDLGAGAPGVVAIVAAIGAATALGYRRDLADQSPYGYNALLCGLALGHGQPVTVALLCKAAALGAFVALLTANLSVFFERGLRLPLLALPFVLAMTVLWPLVGAHATTTRISTTWVPDLPFHLPQSVADTLRAFGGVVFCPTTAAGLLVFLAVLLTSRILAGFAILGVCVATLFASVSPGHVEAAWLQSARYNSLLSCAALGCVFFVPSRAAALWAGAGALMTAWLTLALGPVLTQWGLPLLAWPFVIVTLIMLRALALRQPGRPPFVPPVPGANGETNLAHNRMLRTRFGLPGPVRLALPVQGTWTITQGFNGAHTHQEPWQHALDFEITDANGFPFRGEGTEAYDYYCFDAPICAVLPGTVAFAYSEHPDNLPGSQDLSYPYGNVVIIQHGPALFSVLAHLQQGSVLVHVGQTVTAGTVVAKCGSSGRSPRPHVHLQVQASGYLGAPTLPFEVSHYATVHEGPAKYVPFGVPIEGERVAAAQLALVPELAMLRVGNEFTLHSARTGLRRVRSELSACGLRSLYDTVSGERLYFSVLDGVPTFTTYAGGSKSPLAALALALPRVPPFGGEVVVRESVPVQWVFSGWQRRLIGLSHIFGTRVAISGETCVNRAQHELTATTNLQVRWLGRVWRRVVASVQIEEDAVGLLSLSCGMRSVLKATRAAATPALEAQRLRRWNRDRVFAYLAIPVVAAVTALSLLLSSNQSEARAVPNALAESYRLEAARDLRHAIDAAARAADESRESYFPRLRLAHLETQAKLHTMSAADYAASAKLAPMAVEPLLGQLKSLNAAELYEQAVTVADSILKLDSKNYVAHSCRAWALYRLSHYSDAVEEYSAVLDLYPGDIEMRLGRAYSLAGAKRPVEAGIEFREVLKRVPHERRASAALGLP